MATIYNFYDVKIDTPLSITHNSSQWDDSVIGKLYSYTKGQVFIRELPYNNLNAQYCWRVVDAYFSQEDSRMTYFRAFGLNGEYLSHATFGVNYGSVPQRIRGGFKHRPEFNNNYYIPSQNNMVTDQSGGYTVQVLDLNNPSEGMAFGMYKQGNQHQCLIISFRLFPLWQGYPNDIVST